MGKYELLVGLSVASVLASGNNPGDYKGEPFKNVVFILADDLGWTDLGCYGNKFNETPNIDKLATSGIRFTQAYAACPVCSPTRASILTGKYPARLQLTNYIKGERKDEKSPVLPAHWKPFLEGSETTLPELMKTKGYTTGMVGKWHLGNDQGQNPWDQGFDFSRMIGKNGLDYYNYSVYHDSYENEFTDNGTNYLTDKLTDYGVEFIEQNKQKPFFLYLAYSAPHVLIVPRGDKLKKYLFKYAQSEQKFNPYYAAMLESLDEGVGRIMTTLKENGLLENTLVVFTSDNGGVGLDELGPVPTSMLPFRGWKGHIYEGGTRVPAIISWQGNLKSGSVSNQYYSSIDYLSTFCELAGIDDRPEKVDGKSIVPLLLQPEKMQDNERPLFWHYPHFSNQLGRPAGSVRMGDFKLVELYETGTLELFNLKEDVSESNNLSEKMQAKTKELYHLLTNWREGVNAQMPMPNPALKPEE